MDFSIYLYLIANFELEALLYAKAVPPCKWCLRSYLIKLVKGKKTTEVQQLKKENVHSIENRH